MALGWNGRLRGCCGQGLGLLSALLPGGAHRYDCLETMPGIYLEGSSSGLGHPTKLAGVQYVPLQSGAQGSDFKITDLGLTPLVL